ELRRLRALRGQAGAGAQDCEVERDLLLDPRPAHLHDYVAAAREQRAMRLGDRGGRERLGIDADEGGPAQVLVDHLPDGCERLGRHLVDEPPQLLDVDVRKQVRPGREQLTELDVRRPEVLERGAEAARTVAGRLPASDDSELRKDTPAPAPPRNAHDMERAT